MILVNETVIASAAGQRGLSGWIRFFDAGLGNANEYAATKGMHAGA